MKKLLPFLLLLFLLTGCYNYREINDLAIASGISIKKEDNGEYQLTVEVVNPKKEQDTSSGKEPDFIIYTATGKSMQETFRKMIKESPQKIYAAQIEILILDESLVKEDLKNIVDFFARDPEIRSEFYVLVGKDSDILDVITPLETLSSKNILESLEANNQYLGVANLVTYHDLLANYLNSKMELALPSIEIIGQEQEGESTKNIEKSESDAAIVLSNLAIFKDNKLLGYLTNSQSLAYNFAMGNIKETLIQTDYSNQQFIMNEIIQSSTETKVDVKNKKIKISLKGKASISEVNYDCDLTKNETIEKIQKDLNKSVEKLIKEGITDIIDTYNSDIFGYQDLFYKTDPKYYKKIESDWYTKIFPNLEIEVKADYNIFEKGNLNGGVFNEEG